MICPDHTEIIGAGDQLLRKVYGRDRVEDPVRQVQDLDTAGQMSGLFGKIYMQLIMTQPG